MKNRTKTTIKAFIQSLKFLYKESIYLIKKLRRKRTLYKIDQSIFFLTVTTGAAFVNDIEIINSKAKNTFKILLILYDQYIDDLKSKKQAEDFKYTNINNIAKLLEEDETVTITSTEDKVRRPLNKLRKEIQKRLKNLLGMSLDLDDIIEFTPWTNLANHNFGFRINSSKVCIKAPKNDQKSG